MNWKDIGERALSTFIQTFIVAVPAAVFVDRDWHLLVPPAMAAAAAALSVVKNMIKQSRENR